MSPRRLLIGTLASLSLVGAAMAQDTTPPSGAKASVTLSGGDSVTGTVVSSTPDTLTINHPVLGEIAIPRADVTGVDVLELPPAPNGDAGDGAAAAGAAGAEPVAPKLSFTEGWDGSVSLGLNGSSGNTERFNIRAGISGERLTETMETRTSLLYVLGKDDGATTENRLEFNIRNDWLIPDSKWRYFAQGRAEVDEFQDWDARLSGYGGIGYEFWKDDRSELVGRAGLGGNYLIGGDNDGFTLEALLGLDYALNVNDDQRFKTGVEIYPSLEDAGEFRGRAYAAYEIDLRDNLKLTAGIEDRYDTQPGGDAKKNDLDYFLLLVYSF